MKKLWTSVALACALVLACAATAGATTTITGPDTVEPDGTVTITITTDNEAFAGNISATGLEVGEPSSGISTQDSVVLLTPLGSQSVTYSCKVTGEAGSEVSFDVFNAVESDGEEDEVAVSVSGWNATVGGAPPGMGGPSQPSLGPNTPPNQPGSLPSQPGTSPGEPPSSDTRPKPPGINPDSTPPAGIPSSGVDPEVGAGIGGVPPASSGSEPSAPSDEASSPSGNGVAASTPKPKASVPGGYPKTADATTELWMMFAVACVCAGVAVLAARKAFNKQ